MTSRQVRVFALVAVNRPPAALATPHIHSTPATDHSHLWPSPMLSGCSKWHLKPLLLAAAATATDLYTAVAEAMKELPLSERNKNWRPNGPL